MINAVLLEAEGRETGMKLRSSKIKEHIFDGVLFLLGSLLYAASVSYTHLDVYKRQS